MQEALEPGQSLSHAGKTYKAPGVTVFYDAPRCRHFAECVRGLPMVLNVLARPWIHPGGAAPETVAEVIRRCPSGALHYVLTDGEPERPATPTILWNPLPETYLIGQLVEQAWGARHSRTG